MSSRSPLARRRVDPTAPPSWLVRAAWVLGIVVAATIAWLALNFSGDLQFNELRPR
jgi:hypothetical protein